MISGKEENNLVSRSTMNKRRTNKKGKRREKDDIKRKGREVSRDGDRAKQREGRESKTKNKTIKTTPAGSENIPTTPQNKHTHTLAMTKAEKMPSPAQRSSPHLECRPVRISPSRPLQRGHRSNVRGDEDRGRAGAGRWRIELTDRKTVGCKRRQTTNS